MLIKDLFANSAHKDYQVKDPETFHKEHAKELRRMTSAKVEVDGEIKLRNIKVKSARPKKLVWDEDEEMWMFNCKIKVEVLD